MSLIFKVAVVIALLLFVYALFFKKARPIASKTQDKKRESGDEIMVECNSCKTYISAKEAIKKADNYYCSIDCLKKVTQ